MSSIDAFGLPPLESSIAKIPCVTSQFKDAKGYPSFTYNYSGFDFILDDDPDNKVSEQTAERVLRIAQNPSVTHEMTEANFAIAERTYGEDKMRQRLRNLLESYNVHVPYVSALH